MKPLESRTEVKNDTSGSHARETQNGDAARESQFKAIAEDQRQRVGALTPVMTPNDHDLDKQMPTYYKYEGREFQHCLSCNHCEHIFNTVLITYLLDADFSLFAGQNLKTSTYIGVPQDHERRTNISACLWYYFPYFFRA